MNMTAAAPSGGDLSLRDLILTLKGDRTYLQLEEASGGVVRAQRWNQIVNGIKLNEFPEPRTLDAMAGALNIKVDVMLFAFARALGLNVGKGQSIFAALLPPDIDDHLTVRQRSAVLGVIRAMNDHDEVHDEGFFIASKHPHPGKPLIEDEIPDDDNVDEA
jgi:hypothetical protein